MSESIADGARVKQFVQRKQPALKFCYDHVLKTDAKVEGRVEVAWTVEPGRVADVYVVGNSSGSKALERCLVERISSWRFPEGIEGDITWPFMFRL